MSRQGTAVEQKQRFLQQHKQFLSRGIQPSERLKRIATEGGVELGVLKGAVDKVNRELKQHSRKVYSRQMTEHVTEQIDKFYWASGAHTLESDAADGASDIDTSHTVYRTDDLTQDEHISKLPNRWDISADVPTPADDEAQDVDQDTYLSSLMQLQSLSARRLTLQQKLNTYKTLLALLEPYRRPKENLQPNLVWKDAPLAAELGKTRTLAIRVAGRVGERFGDEEAEAMDEEGDVVMGADEESEKVNKVLESW
ncbi:hypothetical protein P280DRAFT_466744 [Massarina eburnea CBS 473.64]|uniref:Kinetochore protein fta4 n=1 Tax=Massarina eburnea CBS 473.64 TaxID=1395130 RepID=A0A6A6SA04_9PLEO|nr:hypothetical protein P280DRAFT_466744 [Massarina eburnea CBS 473.64]